MLAVTAIAWAATLVVHPLGSGSAHDPAGVTLGSAVPLAHAGHTIGTFHSHGSASPLAFLTGWVLMLTAMMAPLLIPALRHVNARSLPRRRWRSATLLTVAYAVTWSAGGLLLLAGATSMRAAFAQPGVEIAVGVAAAATWQLSPAKQRCLLRHHAHPPIAAFGRAADLDALRFGGTHAAWCFGSCWALMLLPLLFETGHLVVMAIVALWMWMERFDTPVPPAWRLRLPVGAARILVGTMRSRLQSA